jgi:hypothetical protein
LEVKENYVRYFYNPNVPKMAGLKQHPYINELHRDFKQDIKQYGMDPFVSKKDHEKKASVFKPPKPRAEEPGNASVAGNFSSRISGGIRNETM